MTQEEKQALKDALIASRKPPEPKPVEPPITTADEIAMACNGGFAVGKPDLVGFDIVTNSVVTMQWKRCVPEPQAWDSRVERSYNPFSRERMP
jgi:hypothetical protein